jgi:hypothetical protein
MPPAAAMPGRMRRGQVESWPSSEFAFDFQSDQQEEHRHQGVVDPVRDVERADIGLRTITLPAE